MVSKIWKFALQTHGETSVAAPEHATPISAGFDAHGQLSVWMSVFPESPLKAYLFKTVFTGEEMPSDKMFMTTVAQPESGLVFHVFRD